MMKGKLLRVLQLAQVPLPLFSPPPGARVLCLEEHPGERAGDPWFEVLYKNEIYAVDMYMVEECKVNCLTPGSIVLLNDGRHATIVRIHPAQEIGTFFSVLVDGVTFEISSMDIKEIIFNDPSE